MNERNRDDRDVMGCAGSMGRNRRSDSEREGYGSRYGGEQVPNESRPAVGACAQRGSTYPPPWYGRRNDTIAGRQRNDRWSGAHRGQQVTFDERRAGSDRRRETR